MFTCLVSVTSLSFNTRRISSVLSEMIYASGGLFIGVSGLGFWLMGICGDRILEASALCCVTFTIGCHCRREEIHGAFRKYRGRRGTNLEICREVLASLPQAFQELDR